MSRDMLNRIDAKDDAAIDMIFSLVTQSTPELALPRVCLVKATCKSLFEERAQLLGDRWKGWVVKAVRPDGTINWALGGPYTIDWDGEGAAAKAVKIKYINGDTCDVPAFLNVMRDFTCEHPHRDMEARLVKDGFGVTLSDLFNPENNGPWAFRISGKEKDKHDESNPWNKLVKKFQQEIAEQVEQAKAGAKLCTGSVLEGDRQRKELKRKVAKTRAVEQAKKKKRLLTF